MTNQQFFSFQRIFVKLGIIIHFKKWIMSLHIYLSGEIHSNWRNDLKEKCRAVNLDIKFSAPVTDHDASDAAGDILGEEDKSFWRDHKSAKVNSIRTQNSIKNCDIAIIRFGDKYEQWNAAFDAGYCAALDKPYITLHSDEIIHPLKEVDASAKTWVTNTNQIVEILKYIMV